MTGFQIIAIFAAFLVMNALQERSFKERALEIKGRLAVPEPLFRLGRLSLVFAWLLSIVQAAGVDLRFVAPCRFCETAALLLFYAGFAVAVASYRFLGDANKIGLPEERTVLVTGGIYRFMRNPLYTGLFLIDIASCLYTLNPLTLVLTLTAMAVYHRIVKAEEDFLAARFGAEYESYKRRVRRYFFF